MGASWGDVPSGRHGVAGCYSTQTYKHMNSGEGGFLVTDDAGAIVAVVGDVEAADLQSEGLANAVTLATQELQSGVTDDVLTLYARAVQDAGGVETNLTLIQQIHQQLFGELQ